MAKKDNPSTKHLKLLIFIPAYNGSKTVPWVLGRMPKAVHDRADQILIIDDHSTRDSSFLTAIGYKTVHKDDKIHALYNEKNLGYGGNHKRGLQYGIDNGFDMVAVLHGDGQYPVEKILELIKPIEESRADLVFGSRILGDPIAGGMPRWRYLGNRALTKLENKALGMSLSEFHSGFRVYSTAALKKINFQMCSNDYHFDTEILIQFHNKNLRIGEIPIPTHYGPESGSPSVKATFKYALNILDALRRFWLHRKGYKRLPMFE